MEAADCMDLINAIEAAVPVAEWRGAGVDAWPLVRSHLFYAGTGLGHGPTPASRPVALARTATRTASGLSSRARQRVRDRAHEAELRPVDVLMLGDPSSRVLLEGRWYDRHCDTLVDTLDEMGRTALHLEPLHVYRAPRHRPSRPVQLALDADRLRSRVSSAAVDLPGHADFLRLLGQHLPVPPPVRREAVAAQVTQLAAMATRFDRVVAAARPRLALVVDYGLPHMAFHVACRRAGVPSVDLQHGLQGPLHFAYARWHNLPPGGYPELARYFWVWSDFEATAIDAWGRVTGGHEAVVGGDPWLQRWTDADSAQVREYDARFADLGGVAPGDAHVLVTLRWGTDDDSLAAILAAVSATPGMRWWLRDHPGATEPERQRLRRALLGHGRLAGDSAVATEWPLPALLRHMDVHVTHNSSAVIEAAVFGVPSVLTDPEGPGYFPEQVEAGLVSLVPASALAPEVLRVAAARPRAERRIPQLPDRRREVLSRLLG